MSEKLESVDYVVNPSTGCLMRKDHRAYKRWRSNHPNVRELQVYHLVPVTQEAPKVSNLDLDGTRRAHSAPPRFNDWDEKYLAAQLFDTSPLLYRNPPSPPPFRIDVRDIGYTSPNTIPEEYPYPVSWPMRAEHAWLRRLPRKNSTSATNAGAKKLSPVIEHDNNPESASQEDIVASQEVNDHELNLQETMRAPPSSQD